MSKFSAMRKEADKKFGKDPNESAVASRSLDLLEDWGKMAGCNDGARLSIFSRWKKKRECAKYIKDGLYKAREEEYGFLGALLTAVAFQIMVQVIVKWIMTRFFEE